MKFLIDLNFIERDRTIGQRCGDIIVVIAAATVADLTVAVAAFDDGAGGFVEQRRRRHAIEELPVDVHEQREDDLRSN